MIAKRMMSVDELEAIVEEATCPADLFDVLENHGLSSGFYPALSELWRKKYDREKDYAKLRILEQGLDEARI